MAAYWPFNFQGYPQPYPPASPFNQPWPYPGYAPPMSPGQYGSTKWPMLNPALAADSTKLRFDISKKPRGNIDPQTYGTVHQLQAVAYPCTFFRIVSKHFPWSIEIVTPIGSPVTCEAVWDALYAALQEHIHDSEWGLIVGDSKKRESIEKAAKKRQERDPDTKLKRIDWLGENTWFKGLERNEDFETARLMPGSKPCSDTWLVKLGTN